MRIPFHFPAKDCRRTREVIGFNDTWAMIVGIPLVGFLVPIIFIRQSPASVGWNIFGMVWFFSCIYTVSYWLFVRMVMIWKRRRFPKQEETMKRIISSLLLIVPYYLVFSLVMDFIQKLLGAPQHQDVEEWQYEVASVFMILLISSLYESVYLYNRWKESLVEQEKLKREFVQSQLEGLKNQVNPHFLFNSLNTLTYLIPEDQDRAVQFVQKLAKVYRYVLDIQHQKLATLADELQFIESFAYLLKERFGAGFEIKIDVTEQARSMAIVPLSLQILIENAVKHNIVTESQPLHIWIETQNGSRLVVRNNLQMRNASSHSTKLGLMNIRNRFAFFSDKPVDIVQTDSEFAVTLPLLPHDTGARVA